MISLESDVNDDKSRSDSDVKGGKPRSDAKDTLSDNIKVVNEVANLSVGKLINLELSFNDIASKTTRTVKLPINIRLSASVIPNASIINLLGKNGNDTGLVERFHSWRSGRISLIKDLIFCQDLINEYKKANINDESGTTQEIIRRVNNAKKFGLITHNPSLASASNLFVITEENAKAIELVLGGKLSNPSIREKAFDNTYAMIIVVIDREWERVTFYTRGIKSHTDLSMKEIKTANKNSKGPDIMDILKSYNMGMSPNF